MEAAGDAFVHPEYLVTTEWLAAHLDDRNLLVYDFTTYLKPDPVTTFRAESGRPKWAEGHIPGSDYLDLQGELSDLSSKLRFTMPSADQFAAAMSRHGLGEGTRAVLYSAGNIMWATRVWWMPTAWRVLSTMARYFRRSIWHSATICRNARSGGVSGARVDGMQGETYPAGAGGQPQRTAVL